MDIEQSLLAEADAAYLRVESDPARYAGDAAECVRRARAAGDTEALVAALRAEAWARHSLLDNEGARSLLDTGVRLARRHGLTRRLGDLLVTRAVALHELGRHDAAARDLRRADPLVARADRPGLLLQLAVLEHNRGRMGAAESAYLEVLGDPDCPPVTWLKAANNLAVAQTLQGRPHEALELLATAAARARESGPLLRGVIASSRAWAGYQAGQLPQSIRRFEEAGELLAAAGVPLGEHHLEYADMLRDLRLQEEAAAAARAAAGEFDRHGARLMAAEARLRCARLALELGDVATARADAEAAARDFRRQRRPAWAARATITLAQAEAAGPGYSSLELRRLCAAASRLERLGLRTEAVHGHLAAGRAALALGRRRTARLALERAAGLAEGRSLLVRLHGHLARALLAESRSGDVVRACARGLRDLARHRDALPSLELRVLAAGHGTDLGALGLRHLLPSAPPGRILDWLERTRAAGLMRVQPPSAGTDDDLAALRAVEHELREARLGRGEEPAALLARQSAIEARIRRRSWGSEADDSWSSSRTPGDVRGATDLRRALDGRWLVEFAVSDDRLLAVVLEPRRVRVVRLGPADAVRREVDAVAFGLRRLVQGTRFAGAARNAVGAALANLTCTLVAPLGVPADVPLVVVPSSLLTGVPWAALHAAPVSVAPSASLWARRVGAAAPVGVPPVVVAGPDLVSAPGEVVAVTAAHGGARSLLPPYSTVDATVELIRDAGLAHLACHGRFRSDSPLFSALELSDGRLTVYEMLARGVAPHRVVLASCHSGTQRPYEGNEVLGFVGAMMSTGTAGLVAAEVPVPDGACAGAMAVLHQRIGRGETLAQALWHARRELSGGGPEEYVAWCGLAAYGPA